MGKIITLNGNGAIAEAIRQIKPDVVAAYPITPSTAIVQYVAQFVADGLLDCEFVCPESEHSAMSMCIGAAAGGGRVVTATASQGLALMWELLYIAAGLRLPILAGIASRALSAPINIHGDHSDSIGARDAGWIQIFSENSQEAYDNFIQAAKISEDFDVRTPAMVMIDGFITSHSTENVIVEDDKDVEEFVGEFKPLYPLLDVEKPVTLGSIDFTNYYFEHKRNQIEGIENSRRVILKVADEYERKFGRKYGFFELYKIDDAEIAVVLMGSAAGTGKEVVDELREKGEKAGLIKIRVYRPFPYRELQDVLKNIKAIAVLDRLMSPGAYGAPLFTEVRSAVYDLKKRPKIINYIYGLGGRDIAPDHFKQVFSDLEKLKLNRYKGDVVNYLNLRG
ncbi:MAG: pyruvate ferredoxin oxidoreductase [Acidobacteriota bacterium]